MATETITFFSNYSEHVLTRRPHVEIPIPGVMAGWQDAQRPLRIRFKPAVNEKGEVIGRADAIVGKDVIVDHSGWLAAGQEQGVERDEVDALRAHKEFGRDIWEFGHEPGTLYPRAQDLRKLITRASVALDEDALVEIIEKEQRSHNRRDLISEAETALATVREAIAEMQAAQAAAPEPEVPFQETSTEVHTTPAPKAKAKPKAAARA